MSPILYIGNNRVLAHRDTFASLALSIPGGNCGETKQRKLTDNCTAVKPNPALNSFQLVVAEEALELIVDATDLPDSVAPTMLGNLSALDVLNRNMAP